MIKVRNFAALLAISSVAVLPACSMFGGNQGRQTSRASSPSQSYPSPQSQELTQDTTQQVQERLQQQGIYRGHVDGVWGPGTEAAVRSYQQQHNLNRPASWTWTRCRRSTWAPAGTTGTPNSPAISATAATTTHRPKTRTSRTSETHADTGAGHVHREPGL